MTSSDRPDRGFLRSAGVVSVLTLASRVLGMLRDMATAHLLGGGLVNDALTWAWTVPNAFRRLFGEGALGSAFVPVFTRVHEREGLERAGQVARAVISALAVGLVLLVVVLVGASLLLPESWEASLFGPDKVEKARLTLAYTRLLLPYLAAICVIAQFMAVLNSLGEFAVPAFGPVLLNTVWLLGLVVAAVWVSGPGDPRERQGYVIVATILVAAVLQILWHLPALRRRGVPMALVRPRATPEVREVTRLMGPMIVGMGAAQLNVLADRTIAMAHLEDGGTTHLYYGLRLMQFPLGLVSAALVTTVFPTLARLMAQGDRRGTADTARLALRTNLLVAVPAAVGLAVLAEPIVRLLFEGGAFEADNTRATAAALMGYSVGIPFAGSVMLLNRTSYAAGDVRLPVRVGLTMVVVNIGLDLALVGPLQELGLALATTITALLTAVGLAWGVRRRLHLEPGESLVGGVGGPLLLGALMAVPLLGLDLGLALLTEAGRGTALLRVGAGVALGLGVFRLLAPRLAPGAWAELSAVLRRRGRRGQGDDAGADAAADGGGDAGDDVPPGRRDGADGSGG